MLVPPEDQLVTHRLQALEQVEVTEVQQVERPTGEGIDVVIAWVDGRDRKHRAKRKRYLADLGGDAEAEPDAHCGRRFSDNDEIRFCLRSIRNYAPWVRTIWLVTDNQVPAAIDRRRAELDNIRIVDHREIFRGYERLLPTFNSLAIESMLWRIEAFLFDAPRDLSAASTGHGRSIRPVQARLPCQCWLPLPQSQAILADLSPRSPVAQIGPGPGCEAPQHGVFFGSRLPDGEPGRPRGTAEGTYRRHRAYGLHQLSRDRC
jgi:hypothetical protein